MGSKDREREVPHELKSPLIALIKPVRGGAGWFSEGGKPGKELQPGGSTVSLIKIYDKKKNGERFGLTEGGGSWGGTEFNWQKKKGPKKGDNPNQEKREKQKRGEKKAGECVNYLGTRFLIGWWGIGLTDEK